MEGGRQNFSLTKLFDAPEKLGQRGEGGQKIRAFFASEVMRQRGKPRLQVGRKFLTFRPPQIYPHHRVCVCMDGWVGARVCACGESFDKL